MLLRFVAGDVGLLKPSDAEIGRTDRAGREPRTHSHSFIDVYSS